MTPGAPQPDEFWQHPSIQAAVRARDAGRFIRAYRNHPAHGRVVPQEQIAQLFHYAAGNSEISKIEMGRKPLVARDPDRLAEWFTALHVPRQLWWFDASPTPCDHEPGLTYAPDVAATLAVILKLGRSDMDRRSFLRASAFSAAATIAPSRDWLLATFDQAIHARGRVSSQEVDAIRRTFDVWNDLDVLHGGGQARAQLSRYVTGHVIPLLRSNDPATPQGQALFEAAAEQLYILARMAYDDHGPVLAEAYLVQALRLAQEAHAPDLGAHILAGLSDQASFAGSPDEAIQLAKAGGHGLRRRPSPACQARLLALQAKAEAMTGNHLASARSIAASEAAFDRVDPAEEPAWAKYIDVAYLTGEYANACKEAGHADEADRYAAQSIEDAGRQGRSRRATFAQAARAQAALLAHDLEQAASAATEAVHQATRVRSSRSAAIVADLRAGLAPHRRSATVARFFETADLLV